MGILDRFSLQGKVALVTGGAGLYGRQIVAALAEAGACTYVAARHVEPLEALAAEHRAQGLEVQARQFDQGDEASILGLCEAIIQEAGRVDILVNNAVLRPMKKGYLDDAAAFAESMRVNATGLFVITRAFGDVMALQGSGSIINIGSIEGMIGPDPTIYRGHDHERMVPGLLLPQRRDNQLHPVHRQLLWRQGRALQLREPGRLPHRGPSGGFRSSANTATAPSWAAWRTQPISWGSSFSWLRMPRHTSPAPTFRWMVDTRRSRDLYGNKAVCQIRALAADASGPCSLGCPMASPTGPGSRRTKRPAPFWPAPTKVASTASTPQRSTDPARKCSASAGRAAHRRRDHDRQQGAPHGRGAGCGDGGGDR